MNKGVVIFNPGYRDWRIFGRGRKLFPLFREGVKMLRAIFMRYKTILLDKILDEKIDQRLKEKLTDT